MPIFISYARRDGRDLALKLREDLTHTGLDVWLDTAEIEGGASWSNEIENAIERCTVTLALLSAGSFRSEVCRAEQLRALRKGKRVIPLRVQSDAELPLHLEHLNYRDFSDPAGYREMLTLLLADIHSEAPIPAMRRLPPVNADPLPDHYIERPDELNKLRQAVLSDNTDRRTALTALHGMGGIGKSVLAAALCRDEVVRDAFPDGVIWVKIGKNPGSLVEQMKLIGTKLGDGLAPYTSELAGADRLREFLPGKSALIVLDDVWNARHIEPFIVDAPRCRVLFTTRNADLTVSSTYRADVVMIGALTSKQALHLLHQRARRDDPEFPQIARKLGYLPLALSIAGARLEKMNGGEWLASFQHVSQIKLGRAPKNAHESLEMTFEQSVSELADADRALYYTLGIFPEDVWIPQVVVTRLWRHLHPDWIEQDAVELIDALINLALVERDGSTGTLALHDLLHDFTRVRLGDAYERTHHAFLDTYNPDGKMDWYEVADSYLLEHLRHHLPAAGLNDKFHHLLVQSPEWMKAKFVALIGHASYARDLEQAIHDFDDESHNRNSESLLVLTQLWAARNVVHTNVESYTNESLETQVLIDLNIEKTGNRTREALSYARMRRDIWDQFTGLLAISEALYSNEPPKDPDLLNELQHLVLDINDEEKRAHALRELVRLLTLTDVDRAALENILPEAAQAAASLKDEWQCSHALYTVSSGFSRIGDYASARQIADQIKDPARRSDALSKLAITLSKVGHPSSQEVFESAQEAINQISDPWTLPYALITYAVALSEAEYPSSQKFFTVAQEAVSQIPESRAQVYALLTLAASLVQVKDPRSEAVFIAARQITDQIASTHDRAAALNAVALALAKEHNPLLEDTISAAREVVGLIVDPIEHVGALSNLTCLLFQIGDIRAELTFRSALQAATKIPQSRLRALILGALAHVLAEVGHTAAEEVLEAAQSASEQIQDEERRPRILSAISIALAKASEPIIPRQIIEWISDEEQRAKALCAVASMFATLNDFTVAQEIIRQIGDEAQRIEASTALALSLIKSHKLDDAGEVMGAITYENRKVEVLSALAVTFFNDGSSDDETTFRQAHQIAEQIKDPWIRSHTLGTLAFALSQTGRSLSHDVFTQAFQAVEQIQDIWISTIALTTLAQTLFEAKDSRASDTLKTALHNAHEVSDASIRAELLRDIAIVLARIGSKEANGTLSAVHQSINQVESLATRLEVLSTLAAGLARIGDDRATEAFAAARHIARQLGTGWGSNASRRVHAKALASIGVWVGDQGALAALPLFGAVGYLNDLAENSPALETVSKGLLVRILREVIRIAAWKHPFWQVIVTLFPVPEPDSSSYYQPMQILAGARRIQLIDILINMPFMHDKDSREAVLYRTGLARFIPRLRMDEKTEVFVPLLVKSLEEYGTLDSGEPALYPLLRESLKEIGYDERRAFVEGLLR